MKAKTLLILACVAAALIAVALMTSNSKRTQRSGSGKSQVMFKDLPVNDVTRILISTAENGLELLRAESGWIVASKFNYPAKFDKVKSSLMTLSDLEAGDKRDMDKKQRAKVRLFSPLNADADNAAKGTLAQVFTDNEKPVAALLMGSDRTRKAPTGQAMPDGQFVSADDGKTVLVTSAYLGDLSGTDPISWMDTELSSIDAFSITNVTINLHGEKPLVLYTEDGKIMKIDKISGKEKIEEHKTRSVRYALSSLRFDDIASPALDDKAMGFDKASTYRAVTDKDEIYTVTIGAKAPKSDNRYLRLSAEFIGVIPEAPEQKEGEVPVNVRRKQLEEAKARVDASNKRHSSWTYLASPAMYSVLLSTRENLVVRKED